ncbi:hypothetical protein [Candidatus Viridilinea mediisalina]|uniref:Uncharacterized protein n=1 Tax=Candidatus Viridilinea mediisalina TaxID=2024553 RepID=A0A2A6RME8_9CHLR|nr:hypothetical protein [Candidatus Viridilinea mediisalina]PDW04113.1 hypothetical protein CJ255_05320 [Candidatus Viridilinea mediisalina]
MQLVLRANGQQATINMDNAGSQVLAVGQYRYRPAQMARKVRRLANAMWGSELSSDVLNERLTFEALDGGRTSGPWVDSGSFSPRSGSFVSLGRWDEDGTIGIALHELAHEMHMRRGGYDESDGVLREAVSLLAEREAGLQRLFEREPYYTASNLINQLMELKAFSRQPFNKRWNELMELTNDVALSDLVNFYLDKSDRIGLQKWLKRFTDDLELRDALLGKLAVVSLRYSLDLRRKLLGRLVRCSTSLPADQVAYVLDSIVTLDRRYPGDDLGRIIDFCFAPHTRQRRRFFAFG